MMSDSVDGKEVGKVYSLLLVKVRNAATILEPCLLIFEGRGVSDGEGGERSGDSSGESGGVNGEFIGTNRPACRTRGAPSSYTEDFLRSADLPRIIFIL
jgi:hypothetical protein